MEQEFWWRPAISGLPVQSKFRSHYSDPRGQFNAAIQLDEVPQSVATTGAFFIAPLDCRTAQPRNTFTPHTLAREMFPVSVAQRWETGKHRRVAKYTVCASPAPLHEPHLKKRAPLGIEAHQKTNSLRSQEPVSWVNGFAVAHTDTHPPTHPPTFSAVSKCGAAAQAAAAPLSFSAFSKNARISCPPARTGGAAQAAVAAGLAVCPRIPAPRQRQRRPQPVELRCRWGARNDGRPRH
eukprot:366320-Chlamydomonas_euryale.AAC.16